MGCEGLELVIIVSPNYKKKVRSPPKILKKKHKDVTPFIARYISYI